MPHVDSFAPPDAYFMLKCCSTNRGDLVIIQFGFSARTATHPITQRATFVQILANSSWLGDSIPR